MQPDPALQCIDFSLQTMVRTRQFNAFPEGALTFSCWIKFKRGNFDTSEHRLFSYDDRSTSDHPNEGGSRVIVQDPGNITVSFSGTTVSTGARVDDGQWHHLGVSIQQDDLRVVYMPGEPAARDPYEEQRRWQWLPFLLMPMRPPPPPPRPEPGSVGLFRRTVIAVYRDGQAIGGAVLDLDDGVRIAPNGPFVVSFPYFELQDSEDGGERRSRLVDRYLHDLGSIADVRVWAGARTAKQLAVEMTGYLGRHPDLRLHWRLGFAGPPPSVVPDDSGNNNTGKLSSIDTPRRLGERLPYRLPTNDLTGVDLAKADVSHIPLAGCNLVGATLEAAGLDDADLSKANLTGVAFSGASLQRTSFIDAKLFATDFHDTDLTLASFSTQPDWSHDAAHPTILEGATVTTAILGKNWSCLRLSRAKVHGLEAGADLSGIDASRIVFHDAPMSGCRFAKAKFDGADLTGANLDKADFYQCRMVGTTLYNADLSSARLAYADLTGAKLGGNNQHPASLAYAYMPGVTLTNAELFGVDFAYAQIYGEAKFDGAHLEAAKFANANLCGMDLRKAYMKGVDLTGALLMNCRFDGVDLSPGDGRQYAVLAGAFLQGASFVQTNLAGADLSGALVAQSAGSTNVQRLADDGTLETVPVNFAATTIPMGAGNAETIWPDNSRGALSDVRHLVALTPPKPAELAPIDAPW